MMGWLVGGSVVARGGGKMESGFGMRGVRWLLVPFRTGSDRACGFLDFVLNLQGVVE